MIKIIETPQFSTTSSYTYEIKGDCLTIQMDGEEEEFDLTNMPEGRSISIQVDNIPINPIVEITKVKDLITITLIRFYGEDEKEEFEDGYNQLEI